MSISATTSAREDRITRLVIIVIIVLIVIVLSGSSLGASAAAPGGGPGHAAARLALEHLGSVQTFDPVHSAHGSLHRRRRQPLALPGLDPRAATHRRQRE